MASYELVINISEEQADQEQIEKLTISLIRQLRQLDIEYVRRPESGQVLHGTKGGDSVTIGAIILGIGAAVLPNIIDFLQNWVGDRRRVVIEAPNGAKIEFVPDRKLSSNEIIALVKKLNYISK